MSRSPRTNTGEVARWARVEVLMCDSFTGKQLTEAETQFLRKAHEDNPQRYSEAHAAMKRAAVEDIQAGGSGRVR